jgi:hypothetical protein
VFENTEKAVPYRVKETQVEIKIFYRHFQPTEYRKIYN